MSTAVDNNDYATLLIKTARDTGWEILESVSEEKLLFASAFHEATAELGLPGSSGTLPFHFHPSYLRENLVSILGSQFFPTNETIRDDLNMVRIVLQKASKLARSPLLLDPFAAFEQEVQCKLDKEPKPATTERIAEVRQRVGQDLYRKALMTLWNGQCAVTGIDLPEVLRASHSRPWAECEEDRQRLDPYNGFLLSANLDLLFDCGLISFDDSGDGILSPRIQPDQAAALGLEGHWGLRRIDEKHKPYLDYHRENIFKTNTTS